MRLKVKMEQKRNNQKSQKNTVTMDLTLIMTVRKTTTQNMKTTMKKKKKNTYR